MAEEIVNAGYLRDPETHEIFLPQTDESLVTGLTNKIDTAINNKINSLDGIATIPDTGTGVNVITEVSETNGILSSKQKTITEGNKIDVTGASGNITIAHESITTIPTDNSVDPPDGLGDGERESYVITDVTTDGYGHITAYTKDKSTNLIAADIKAPVKQDDDSTWNYRETGGVISIGEDTARIPSLKGNTVVWNQIANKEIFNCTRGSKSYEGNAIVNTIGETVQITEIYKTNIAPSNQSLYIRVQLYSTKPCTCYLNGSTSTSIQVPANTWVDWILPRVYKNHCDMYYKADDTYVSGDIIKLIPTIIDLTKMFGEGNELTVEQFEKLFPNSYYPYCEGRLVNLGGYGVKMNQLVQNGNFVNSEHWNNATSIANGIATKTTETQTNYASIGHDAINYIVLNKYFIKVEALSNNNDTSISILPSGYFGDGYSQPRMCQNWSTLTFIWTAVDIQNHNILEIFGASSNGPCSFSIKNVNVIDLTEMFGPGSEPTLEECEQIFTEDYYEYNTGTEMNIFDAIGDKKLGLESTGFNQWDEEWTEGLISQSDGETITPASGYICSNNKIPVISGKTYYLYGLYNGRVFLYDANGKYITSVTGFNYQEYEIPDGVGYIRFQRGNPLGVYQNDICINIFDPNRNGTYEPYKKDTLDLDWIREIEYTPSGSSTTEKLFPYGLLSAGSVHDEVTETKAIKRVGVVDLGSLNWTYVDSNNRNIFWTNDIATSIKPPTSLYTTNENVILVKSYRMMNQGFSWVDKDMSILYQQSGLSPETVKGTFVIVDNSYSDKSTFESAMSGVMLYYELETPIEIPLDEPHGMSYLVDDNGTEQQTPINVSSVINAPFVGTFEYMSNFKEGVLDLMGRFNDFTPTTEIIPDSATANSTLPTSQAVIDYMRAGGNGVKPVYESGDEVTPTTDVHAGLKTEVGNNSYKYYKIPFSAVTNDLSTGTSQVQIILNGNFS